LNREERREETLSDFIVRPKLKHSNHMIPNAIRWAEFIIRKKFNLPQYIE